MRPDTEAVAEFLWRIGHPVAIVARKPLDGSDRQTVVWPSDIDDATDLACGLARDHHAVYVNLNPLTAEMLKTVPAAGVSVRDSMIARRTRILIDIDGPPKEQAREQFDALLAEIGEPLIATDSGNGHALIYTCDLPNSRESTAKVTAYLRQLKQRYPLVDINVASASRLTRVAGTLNKSKITGGRIATTLL